MYLGTYPAPGDRRLNRYACEHCGHLHNVVDLAFQPFYCAECQQLVGPGLDLFVLLGAEGCAELGERPWLRDATREEQDTWLRVQKLDVTALRDGVGRPYWLKALRADAPDEMRRLAMLRIRTLRLTE